MCGDNPNDEPRLTAWLKKYGTMLATTSAICHWHRFAGTPIGFSETIICHSKCKPDKKQ